MSTRARYPRATTQRTARLGTRFWALANEEEGFTERREPQAVVRHAVASLRVLQSESPGREYQALTFLMGLEHDPHYASPEQSRGGDKTSRSLVYSIGVLLFERLTGHHPFVVSFSPLQAAIMRDSTAAHGTGPLCHVPTELRSVLNRAMSAFPDDRYADVEELRAALDTYLCRQRARRRRALTAPPPCPNSAARHLYDARRPGSVEHARGSMVARFAGDHRVVLDAALPGPLPPRPPAECDESAPARASGDRLRLAPVLVSAGVSGLAVAVALSMAISAPATAASPAANSAPATWSSPASSAQAPVTRLPGYIEAAPAGAASETVSAELVAEDPPGHPSFFDPMVVAEDSAAELAFFDPEVGGSRAARAFAPCLSDNRRGITRLRVTLRYATNGLSDRVYFGLDPDLYDGERSCLASALVGIDAGGPPDEHTHVTYALRFQSSGPGHHRTVRVD